MNVRVRKKIISFFHYWLGTVEPVVSGVETLEAVLIVGCADLRLKANQEQKES